MNTTLTESIIYNQVQHKISTIFYWIVIIFLFLFLLVSNNLYSQNNVLKPMQNLSISEGLAHNGVTSILEDSRGYLWIGTFDGLNRYDGYKCKIYKNTVDKKVFINHRIRIVKEDAKGNLWIGTDEGVAIYKYRNDKFENIYANQVIKKGVIGPIIRDILINDKEVVAVTDNDGILFFDDDYNFKKAFVPSSNLSKETIVFFKAEALDKDTYLFSTSVGLLLFNRQNKQFQKVLKSDIDYSNFINFIDDKTILVSLEEGIGIVDYQKKGKQYSFELRQKSLKSERVNSTIIDSEGSLWLGTANEGALYIDNVSKFLNGQDFDLQRFTLSTPFLRVSCFSNTNRGFWLGTFDKGIFRFNLKENSFKTYNKAMNYDFDLHSNSISSFAAIDSHRVYITSKPNGLSLFNTKTERFESTNNLPAIVQKSNKVFIDSKKNLWFKVNNKLKLFRIKNGTNRVEVVTSKSTLFNQISIYIIEEDAEGNIWVGTEKNVYRIQLDDENEVVDIETLSENPFFSSVDISRVRSIYFDKYLNCIWVGSSFSGLLKIELSKDKTLKNAKIRQFLYDSKKPNSISSNFISSIIRLPDNSLWLSTERGGICKVLNSDKNPTFQSFSEKQGLSNNVVKNIITYDGVNLWLPTNIGLNLFNTKDLTFRKFSKKDGLPFDDFDFSTLKLDNGQFVFSGFNGICYFNPNNVSSEELLPTLEFGDFKVVNNVVSVGEKIGKRVLLSERLKDKSTIKLKYNENVFSVEINSLHFSNTENHYLKYQLLPVNENWIEVPSNQRTISYSGLQSGEYTLRVKASNSLNDWTEVKELTIIISPPFWKTILAYILYVIAAAFLLYYVISVVLRIQSLNHNLEIEKLQKDSLKQINAAKLRFFANISHEIKTPITLISGPISLLRNKFKYDNDISDKLILIERQSKKISQLVDQVHDFQKADSNILKMNYSYFCFDNFINEVSKDFEFMATNDNKKLIINGIEERTYVSADKDKLEIIFNNLLNNAFKHTKTNDTITINYTVNDKDLKISVSDTGKGISEDDLPFIFDRFYQSQKKHNINLGGAGIGLAFSKRLIDMHYGFIEVESEYGSGTTFSVRLPIVKEAPIENQEAVEAEILSLEESYEDNAQINETIDLSAIKVDSAFANAQIFMAEDNSDMRIFVAEVLSNFFKVKTFANGQECLDAMEEEWPDLIVSDVSMPELNGLELCKYVKSDIKTSHIPIVLLTACVTVDDQIQGIKYGADAYIRKPFNVAHLVTTTEALLKNRKQLRERFQVDFPMTLEKSKISVEDTVFLEKLYALIADNLDNNELDLDSFAKQLFLNRTHFYQKVKALTNQTPYELLKEYRLKKAAELLAQEKRTVNEVFLMTGFKSRTHFSKLFKEKYGLSPGKFSKSAR